MRVNDVSNPGPVPGLPSVIKTGLPATEPDSFSNKKASGIQPPTVLLLDSPPIRLYAELGPLIWVRKEMSGQLLSVKA